MAPPDPVAIGPSPPWVMIVGAVFGGITLFGFFLFAYLAGKNPEFICNAFAILAVTFALGASLSAGFIGGAAAINGNFGSAAKDNAIAFSAGGGVAVLFIALYAFNSYFKEDVCKGLRSQIDKLQLEVVDFRKSIADRDKKAVDLASDYEKRLQQEVLDRKKSTDDRDKKLADLASDYDKRMSNLKSQPITIVARTDQKSSTPLNQLLITYTGKQGPQVAKRIDGKNVFKIPRQDLDDDDPGIYLSLDPLLSPQTEIVVDRIDHNIDPLQINLTLHYDHTSQQPR